MKNIQFLFIVALGFFSFDSFAGSDSDSSKHTSFFFSIDYRNSFITSSDAHVIGFRGGAEVNKKFRVGGGYHFLNSEIIKKISIDGADINTEVRLRYGSVSAEYVLFTATSWQVTAPVIFGFGESAFIPPVTFGIRAKHFTLFLEPALTFQYNIIPFIGIGTGIGYRFMPVGDSSLRPTFATPLYDVRIKILMDDVIEALFPNGLWKKKSNGEKSSGP